MSYLPPRWLERLAEVVVPPAACEHVVGDLAESSRNDAQFVSSLASILPRVIWSQARRRATINGLALNAVLTAVALFALASLPASVFHAAASVRGWLAVPVAVWVVGSALAAAYAPRSQPVNYWMLGAAAVAAAGSAALLHLPVITVVIGVGCVLPIVAFTALAAGRRGVMPPLSLASLPAHAQKFQRAIRWRNIRESVAGIVVIAASVDGLWKPDPMERVAAGLMIAGVLFVIGFMYWRAGARPVPANLDARVLLRFHRGEIVRQRNVLRLVPLWYLLPFVPGMLVRMGIRWQTRGARTLVGALVVFIVFGLVWKLNLWGAQLLDKQLLKADALEGEL